jgi:hypothetical protein
MTTLAPVVTELTVRNVLQSSFQVGKSLYLDGYGSTRPDLEQALIVDTGAQFSGPVTVGAMEVTGDANIAGLLQTTLYGNIIADSLDVAGLITAVGSSTNLFAPEFYVAPVGDDVYGNGSATNPFQTVAKAIASASEIANSTIVLRSGTYPENVLIQSYVNIIGQSATIAGNVFVNTASIAGGNIALQGLTITGTVNVTGTVAYGVQFTSCNILLENIDRPAIEITGSANITAQVTDCMISSSSTGQLASSVLYVTTGTIFISNSQINVTAASIYTFFNAVSIYAEGSMVSSEVSLSLDAISDPDTTISLLDIRATFTFTGCLFALRPVNSFVTYASSCGIRITGSSTLTLLRNSFDVSNVGVTEGYAVDNSNPSPVVITQGNVSLPNTLTGFATPVTALTTF